MQTPISPRRTGSPPMSRATVPRNDALDLCVTLVSQSRSIADGTHDENERSQERRGHARFNA